MNFIPHSTKSHGDGETMLRRPFQSTTKPTLTKPRIQLLKEIYSQ